MSVIILVVFAGLFFFWGFFGNKGKAMEEAVVRWAEEHDRKYKEAAAELEESVAKLKSTGIFLEREMEMQKEVFKKNTYGSAVTALGNEGKRCAQLLRDLSVEFIRGNFNGARKVIDNSFVIGENLLNIHRQDIMDIIFGLAKDEMSYKDFIGMAYDSVLHENYILFYAMINLIVYKLNTAQRMFFDDTYCLKDTLAKIEDKLNLKRTFDAEKTKLSYFYEECQERYYPAGDVLMTKDDYLYKQDSIFGDYDDLELDFVKNEFLMCIDNERMRKFITEVDNYLNTIGNATKSSEMWNYLVEALMCDYLQSPFMWNEDMSKSLLKAIVGYSECYRNESIVKYSEVMRNFVLSKLDRLRTIISLFPRSSKNSTQNDVNMLEIAKFLINLYYVFPFKEVLDFASIEVVGDLEWIILNDNYEKEKTLKEIKEVIHQLENAGVKNKIGGAGFGLAVPAVSKIVECGVLQQSEKPQFTTIYLGVNFAPYTTEKIELTFFDENKQEIVLGCNLGDKMIVELGEIMSNGGYDIYEIPILSCSNIASVKARIIGSI